VRLKGRTFCISFAEGGDISSVAHPALLPTSLGVMGVQRDATYPPPPTVQD
jgi:hypothetical protein